MFRKRNLGLTRKSIHKKVLASIIQEIDLRYNRWEELTRIHSALKNIE